MEGIQDLLCSHSYPRCQTYEGGFGAEPGNEAHGGYTFCALACLVILGRPDVIDLPRLIVSLFIYSVSSSSTGQFIDKWIMKEDSKEEQIS